MYSGRFYCIFKIFDRRRSGAHKYLFFLQINKSHKVVVCVNKKFALHELRHLLILNKAEISATPKPLIFVFKLEMVKGSISSCKNVFNPNDTGAVNAS